MESRFFKAVELNRSGMGRFRCWSLYKNRERWRRLPVLTTGGLTIVKTTVFLIFVTCFERELTQDYLNREGSVSGAVQVQVDGKSAYQVLFEGSKLFPPHGLISLSFPTRITSTRPEANGYFHD